MPSIRARLVAGRVLGLLGQGIPAADDPGGIVQREIAVGGEGALKGAAHLGLGDREHQDLVVGEQPVLHGPPEPEPVKLGPVDGFIVHGGQDEVLALGIVLDVGGVDARGRRHVEPFGGPDVPGATDPDEGGLILAGRGRTGRPVRLIADRQVESQRAEACARWMTSIDW